MKIYQKLLKTSFLFIFSLICPMTFAQQEVETADILILYDEKTKVEYSGEVNIIAEQFISDINMYLSDSGAQLMFNLAGVKQFYPKGPLTPGNLLREISDSQQVKLMRDSIGADFVALLAPIWGEQKIYDLKTKKIFAEGYKVQHIVDDYFEQTIILRNAKDNREIYRVVIDYEGCSDWGDNGYFISGECRSSQIKYRTSTAGVAWRTTGDSTFSVTHFTTSSLVFAHEIGHNMGLGHTNSDEGTDYKYGRGYEVPGLFNTIMHQYISSRIVPFYSNVIEECADGQLCGIEDERDSARAISNLKSKFSKHREIKTVANFGPQDIEPIFMENGYSWIDNTLWRNGEKIAYKEMVTIYTDYHDYDACRIQIVNPDKFTSKSEYCINNTIYLILRRDYEEGNSSGTIEMAY